MWIFSWSVFSSTQLRNLTPAYRSEFSWHPSAKTGSSAHLQINPRKGGENTVTLPGTYLPRVGTPQTKSVWVTKEDHQSSGWVHELQCPFRGCGKFTVFFSLMTMSFYSYSLAKNPRVLRVKKKKKKKKKINALVLRGNFPHSSGVTIACTIA